MNIGEKDEDADDDDSSKKETATTSRPGAIVVTSNDQLLRLGVVRLPLPQDFDAVHWATELSKVTPAIMAFEGDGEYAFYRNIMDEPDFPLHFWEKEQQQQQQQGDASDSCSCTLSIAHALQTYFRINVQELRLDDAFCVHYNHEQENSGGAKHMDPSDITLNLCLEKSDTVKGSEVLFHGKQQLYFDTNTTANEGSDNGQDLPDGAEFLVPQQPGYLTMHYGHHYHQTLPLRGKGRRTNIVMTLCFKDESRSDVALRTCY